MYQNLTHLQQMLELSDREFKVNGTSSAQFLLIFQHTYIAFLVFKLKTTSLAQKSETEKATVHPL